jgi:outer membrane protein assembly factor BamB
VGAAVIVGSTGGSRLYAFDPRGALKWSTPNDHVFLGPLAIDEDGSILFAGLNGPKKVSPTGTVLWYRYELIGDSSWHTPVIAPDGSFILGNSASTLAGFTSGGIRTWTYLLFRDADEDVTTADFQREMPPVLGADGTIYVCTLSRSGYGFLDAFAPDGTLHWRYYDPEGFLSAPVMGPDGTLYVGSRRGILLAFPTDSGGPAPSGWPSWQRDPRNTGRR